MSALVVLITGALIGIGRAAALAFAKGGSRVVTSGRHKEAGQALATVLHALGAEADSSHSAILDCPSANLHFGHSGPRCLELWLASQIFRRVHLGPNAVSAVPAYPRKSAITTMT